MNKTKIEKLPNSCANGIRFPPAMFIDFSYLNKQRRVFAASHPAPEGTGGMCLFYSMNYLKCQVRHAGRCPTDEKHCGCVPILRGQINNYQKALELIITLAKRALEEVKE